MRICFVTDGEEFHGASPEERALGGSETALVQMARALARRGHSVQVFCRCPAPGLYHGVIYHDRTTMTASVLRESWDVLIVSRFFGAFSLPFQAGLTVLWNHDILDHSAELARHLQTIDIMFVLSRFHAQDYAGKLEACANKLVQTRNGLDLGLLERAAAGVTRTPGRMIYASRPERGLKLLLEQIWPRLLRQFPHLRLTICGYQLGNTPIHPSLQKKYIEIERLTQKTPGVEVLGPLAKEPYYAHLASCECMLYPCVFPEISCIAALEAQALGVPIVTSDRFAMAETVLTPQFRVGGEPGSNGYIDQFIMAVQSVISSPQQAADRAAAAKATVVSHNSWDAIAGQWEELFFDTMAERRVKHPMAVAADQIIHGERLAASRLLQRPLPAPHESPPPDPNENALIAELTRLIDLTTGPSATPNIGVVSIDHGRTAAAIAAARPGLAISSADEHGPAASFDLLVIRDVIERAAEPDAKLKQMLELCLSTGHVLLCVASGAWPLICPGHASRNFDLDQDDLRELLAGRPAVFSFVPQGLVKTGARAYRAGRWLALAPVDGPLPGKITLENRHLRARIAPSQVEAEVLRARLL